MDSAVTVLAQLEVNQVIILPSNSYIPSFDPDVMKSVEHASCFYFFI